MVQFKAIRPNTDALGDAILAFVDGLGSSKKTALKILENKGLANPQFGQWYPV